MSFIIGKKILEHGTPGSAGSAPENPNNSSNSSPYFNESASPNSQGFKDTTQGILDAMFTIEDYRPELWQYMEPKGFPLVDIKQNLIFDEISKQELPFSGDPESGFLSESGAVEYSIRWRMHKKVCMDNSIYGMKIMIYHEKQYADFEGPQFNAQGDQTTTMENLESVLSNDNDKVAKFLSEKAKESLLYETTVEFFDSFGVTEKEIFGPVFVPGKSFRSLKPDRLIDVVGDPKITVPKNVGKILRKNKIQSGMDDAIWYAAGSIPVLSGPPPGSDWQTTCANLMKKGVPFSDIPKDTSNPAWKSKTDSYQGQKGQFSSFDNKGMNSMGGMPNSNNKPFPVGGAQGQGAAGGAQSATQNLSQNPLIGYINHADSRTQQLKSDAIKNLVTQGEHLGPPQIMTVLTHWHHFNQTALLKLDKLLLPENLIVHFVPLRYAKDLSADPPCYTKKFLFDHVKFNLEYLQNLKSFTKPTVPPSVTGKNLTEGVVQLEIRQNDKFANAVRINRIKYSDPSSNEEPYNELIYDNYALTDNMGPETITDFIVNEAPGCIEYQVTSLGPFYGSDPNHDNKELSASTIVVGQEPAIDAVFGEDGRFWDGWTVSNKDSDDLKYINHHINRENGDVTLKFKVKGQNTFAAEIYVENVSQRRYSYHHNTTLRRFGLSSNESINSAGISESTFQNTFVPIEDPADEIIISDSGVNYDLGNEYRFYVALHRLGEVDPQIAKTYASLKYFVPQSVPFSPSVDIAKIEKDDNFHAAGVLNNLNASNPHLYHYFKGGLANLSMVKKVYKVTLDLRLDVDIEPATKMLEKILEASLDKDSASFYISKFKESSLSLEEIVAFKVKRHYLSPDGYALYPDGISVGPSKGYKEHIWLPGIIQDKLGHPSNPPVGICEGDSLRYEIELLLRTPDFFFDPKVKVAEEGESATSKGLSQERSFFSAFSSTVNPTYLQQLGEISDDTVFESNLDKSYQGQLGNLLPNAVATSEGLINNMLMGRTGLTDTADALNIGVEPPAVTYAKGNMEDYFVRRKIEIDFVTTGPLEKLHSWIVFKSTSASGGAYFPVSFIPNTHKNVNRFIDPCPWSQLDGHIKYMIAPVMTNFMIVKKPAQIDVNQVLFPIPLDL